MTTQRPVRKDRAKRLIEKLEFLEEAACSIQENPEILVPPFDKWVRENLYIRDRGGRGNIRFDEWSRGQERVAERLMETRAKEKNIRLVIHKMRQMAGITTLIQAWQLWLIIHNPHRWAATIAHEEKAVKRIHKFISHYWEYLPEELKPDGKMMIDGLDLSHPHNSALYLFTAGSVESGRSPCINYVHYSEFAFFEKPAEFRQGLSAAIPDESTWDTSEVFESTAKGEGEFKDLLDMGFDPDNEDYDSIFLTWSDEPRCIAQIPRNFTLNKRESEFKAERGLTLEQMAFWRKQVNKFRSWERTLQEYPQQSRDAFLYYGGPVFDQERLQLMLDTPEVLKPKYEVELEWMSETYPLVRMVEKEFGRLHLWALPEKGRTYVVGMDVAYGRGRDYTDITIIDIGSGEVVGHFRDNRIQVDDAAIVAFKLGAWWNYAEIAVEHNGPGIAVITSLLHGLSGVPQISAGYPCMYRDIREDQHIAEEKAVVGFQTTKRTKQPAIAQCSQDWSSGVIHVFSKVMLLQMKGFAEDDDGRVVQNHRDEFSGLKNDDSVISLCIANFLRRKWVEGTHTTRKLREATWDVASIVRGV